jgi:prolyl-tRNA synthetase
MIGGLIMAHSDDDGLNLPSQVAPYPVVIIPVLKGQAQDSAVIDYCREIKASFEGALRVILDTKEVPPQNKKWDYVRKGVPYICEIGAKELESRTVSITKRAKDLERVQMLANEFIAKIASMLMEHDLVLAQKNKGYCERRIRWDIKSFDALKEFFAQESGFVIAKWSGTKEHLDLLDEIAVSIRCIPHEQSGTQGECILTGNPSSMDVVLSKSY